MPSRINAYVHKRIWPNSKRKCHLISHQMESNRIEFCVTKPMKRQNSCSIPHIMILIRMIESHANFIRRKFEFRYRRMFDINRLFDIELLVCFAFDGICVCFFYGYSSFSWNFDLSQLFFFLSIFFLLFVAQISNGSRRWIFSLWSNFSYS